MNYNEVQLKTILGNTLVELAEQGKKVAMVDADLGRCSGGDIFAKEYPEHYYNVGIAEQNAMGIAGGLAAMGYSAFLSTFSIFTAMRSCDQLRNTVGYNHLNVKICGTYAGITTGTNGGSHMSVEDVSIVRAIPDIIMLEPGDGLEFRRMLKWVCDYDGPVYIRMPKGPMPALFDAYEEYDPSRATFLHKGTDVSIVAAGLTSAYAVEAAGLLKRRGVEASVLSVSSYKPVDKAAIKAAANNKFVVTVENHSVIGGLGSIVAEVMAEEGSPGRLVRLGLQDCYGECAPAVWLARHYGIDAESICGKVCALLRNE